MNIMPVLPGKIKTALVYPYRKKTYIGCSPPISLLYLAAAIRQAGEEVIVIDMDDGNLTYDDVVRKLTDYSPDLIGMALFSAYLSFAYKLHRMLAARKDRWKILLGGPHASARPIEVLETFKGSDFVLRGESEESIVELIDVVGGKRDPGSVLGLSYIEDGKIIENPDRPVNKELDSIRFPERKLLADAYRDQVFWRWGHRGTTDLIITSRGCPYNCNFCFKVAKRFRFRSPENILEELVKIKSMGTNNVQIMDDLFVWNKERCMKILAMIKAEKLNMKFKVRARVDGVDGELLRELKSAGAISIVYGIESGSQKMLDLMNKRTTVEMNYNAIRMTKKAGMQCYADMLIGYPGETMETIHASQKLIRDTRPTGVAMSVMYPLPNTKVYEEAKADGTLRDDWSVDGSRAWIKLPWTEDKKTIFRIRDGIMKEYLHRPSVIFNVIRFGLFKLDMRQFWNMVVYYIDHTLRR